MLGIIKDAPSISGIGATEGPRLDANSIRRIEAERAESSIAILASVAKESRETVARDQQAAIAQLQTQALRYRAALDNISQGVCFFDGEGRLILCNRRFAEIYRLDLDQTPVGATLREIIERRVAAGACPMSAEDYLAHCARINSGLAPNIWIAALPDGRRIQVNHQPMPDGGWVSTHEDVTELHDKRAIADERISLQILIDQVPDYLWIKDSESRFVVVNKALASDHGRVRTSDMIGLTDADIHAPDVARDFREIEQEILSCGEPMLDREEWITDAAGARKCLSSSKVPLRNEKGDIFGLVGIARDITERKRADALRDGQARNPRDDRDERPSGQSPRAPHASHRIPIVRNLRLDPAARGRRPALAPRSRAEPCRGLHWSDRRRPHRSECRLVRDCRLPARGRYGRRYHGRSAVGGFQGLGRPAWASFVLVDADLLASRRGSRHLRDVFEDGA